MVLLLDLYWCLPVDVALSEAGVVEPFHVVEHGVSTFDAGVPPLPVEQFDVYASPEGFDDGVVVGITDSAQ